MLGGQLLRGPGGKGANAAMAARKAGAELTFLTAFGDDDFGRELVARYEAEGFDLRHAKHPEGKPNQVALILVGDDGENLIGVAPGASAELGPRDIENLPDEVFDPSGVLLACLEVPLPAVAAGLKRARARGMKTVLNPAPADRSVVDSGLEGVIDVLTPNQEEAAMLSGLPAHTAEEACEAGSWLRKRLGCDVLVTLGGEGCLVLPRAGGNSLVPAPRVKVVDTVGAGDAFNGALAVALAEGKPLLDAAAWACAAGSLAVTKPGAQGATPDRREIERLVNG